VNIIEYPPATIRCGVCGSEAHVRVYAYVEKASGDVRVRYQYGVYGEICEHMRARGLATHDTETVVEFWGGKVGFAVAPQELADLVVGWENSAQVEN